MEKKPKKEKPPKKEPVPRNFTPPTVEEVELYMTNKWPSWPTEFLKWYAARFWHHYDSGNWLIAGRTKMKKWTSAVCGQWGDLKYDAQEKFNQIVSKNRMAQTKQAYMSAPGKEDAVISGDERTIEYMQELYEQFTKHPTLIDPRNLANCYDWFKEKRMILIDKEQRETCMQLHITDVDKAKKCVVECIFKNMAMRSISIRELYNRNNEKKAVS